MTPWFDSRGFWERAWISASLILAAAYALRWLVLPSGGLVLDIVKGVQILVVCVAIFALFRWAVLRERDKKSKYPADE